MKLTNLCSTTYKSIDNTGVVNVDPQVTCFVGKNEAGKTAIFETLLRLNPVHPSDSNFIIEDYPRRDMNAYKKVHDAKPATAITATFTLNEDELQKIKGHFGDLALTSAEIIFVKKYNNQIYVSSQTNESDFVKNAIKKHGVGGDYAVALGAKQTIKEVLEYAVAKAAESAQVKNLCDQLKPFEKGLSEAVNEFIKKSFLPKFFYFDDYSILPGRISLNELKTFRDNPNSVPDGDKRQSLQTALALINFVGATIEEFLIRDRYETLKASLEAASNAITDQVFEYWTQNTELAVEFALEPVFDGNNQLRDTALQVRIQNKKHRVTVPFDKRSKGFVWFFSFLVAFSDYQKSGDKIILLLDEPGLNLHAKAQFDLLRFIDQELSPYHQVLYSTHSPFMIPPAKLERVRTVHDKDKLGTVVSNDPLSDDADTVFPLQAALGYDLAQTLFLGPNTLIAEGPSELVYFNCATVILEKESRVGLSNKWVVVPVGGADKIPTFVSLIGANQLNIAIAIDISQKDKQRIDNLIKNNFLERGNLVTMGDIAGSKNADVEDLFNPDRYLDMVNLAYEKELSGKKIKASDVATGDPRIVKRIEDYFKKNSIASGEFNHYRVAFTLLSNSGLADKVFDAASKTKFESLFQKINPLLRFDASKKTEKVSA